MDQSKGSLQYLLFCFLSLMAECSQAYSYSYKNEEPNEKKKKKRDFTF